MVLAHMEALLRHPFWGDTWIRGTVDTPYLPIAILA
jgi:hypothetical protein